MKGMPKIPSKVDSKHHVDSSVEVNTQPGKKIPTLEPPTRPQTQTSSWLPPWLRNASLVVGVLSFTWAMFWQIDKQSTDLRLGACRR